VTGSRTERPGAGAAWTPGDGTLDDRLTLADWRRQVAALYVEVRAAAVTDPEAAWDTWRTVRERLFREHPQSPVPPAERATFQARHYRYDPGLRFVVPVESVAAAPNGPPSIALPNSGPGQLAFTRFGQVRLPFPAGTQTLAVYWLHGYAGGLFVPFRDATNGSTTYGAGRYLLDAAKSFDLGTDPATGQLILDANFASQPSCAFDPRWACPLAPPENRLDIPVEAGERLT
jgi:uncharacterized protein (DUF1684 family)